MSPPNGAMGWSAVCDHCVSRSYSLTFSELPTDKDPYCIHLTCRSMLITGFMYVIGVKIGSECNILNYSASLASIFFLSHFLVNIAK